jgi:hypothetical protein
MQNLSEEPTATKPGARCQLKIIDGRLVEVGLGCDGCALAARSRPDFPPSTTFVEPGADPDAAAMQPPCRRSKYDAKSGRSLFDEADVDGVIVTAAHEFLGPVQWVDKEIDVVVRRNSARRDLLLRDDWNAGRGTPQGGEDDELRGSVRLRHRRPVVLGFDLEAAPNNFQDRFARFARASASSSRRRASSRISAAPS